MESVGNLPPHDEYWKHPSFPLKGDDNPEPLLINIAWCLTVWETVESALADIFATFVESKSEAAGRAYGGIVGGNSRSDMLINAAEVFFARKRAEGAPVANFTILMKHVGKAASIRNEIAHGYVVQYTGTQQGFFLEPPRYNSRKTRYLLSGAVEISKDSSPFDGLLRYRYTSPELSAYLAKFVTLREVAHLFHGDLLMRYATKP